MTNADSSTRVNAAVDACRADVNDCLARFLDGLALPDTLDDAVRYSLLAGGKRVRPLLAWMSCEAVGADPRVSVAAGCAIELVHAFSLVHDDLPSIDNDDLRRGRPSLHVRAGEANAILAGDAMLALAFHLVTGRTERAELSARLCAELASATASMIAGQVIDVQGARSRTPATLESLSTMHRLKTGALIAASCRMGGMCALDALGRTDEARLDALTDYGDAIGLMFQIVDDLLDVEQASERIGKTAGSDDAAGKLTYPSLIGIDGSRREIARLREEAIRAADRCGPAPESLRALADELASRTR